jgi:hypothetical protein
VISPARGRRRSARRRLLSLWVVAALVLTPVTPPSNAAPPPLTDEELRELYEELASVYGRFGGRLDYPDGAKPWLQENRAPANGDEDGDGIPDGLDVCPTVPDPTQADGDLDGVGDACDGCPTTSDPAQADGDLDGVGDLCDGDADNDGALNGVDPCPLDPDDDDDGDGTCSDADNCAGLSNPAQSDSDGDGVGDACDNCPGNPDPDQADADGDGIGNVCDVDDDADGDPDGPRNFFIEDFEAGEAGWVSTGFWHLSSTNPCTGQAPGYTSGPTAWYYGNESKCEYTTGNNPNQGMLLSPTIPGITDGTRVEFDLWREVENFPDSGGLDLFTVEASNDGFVSNIVTLLAIDGTTDNFSWTPFTFSLAQFSGGSVQIRFNFNTGDGVQNAFAGILIDRFRLHNNDNCPLLFNLDQSDSDSDTVGDVCDVCPAVFNPDQTDTDGDGVGDVCIPSAFGRLFVAEGDTDQIHEINPETGATINSFATPEPANGATEGLAYDPVDDVLYYTTGFGSETIWKLDSADGTQLGTLPDPSTGRIDGLGFAGGFLYAQDFIQELVLVIDPATGATVNSFPTTPARNLGGGFDAGLYATQQFQTLHRVSPADGTIQYSFSTPGFERVFGVGFESDNLWIVERDTDTLKRLDPLSGVVIDSYPDPTPGTNVSAVAAGSSDTDGDLLPDDADNCPDTYNPGQADLDNDGTGDVCDDCPNDPDNDLDGDGICGGADVCPADYDPGQADTDLDGVGDLCDACPLDPDNDVDRDGICSNFERLRRMPRRSRR